MAQELIQTQEQKLLQRQRLTQQQMLQVHLIEMPLTQLEDAVRAELDDNMALERSSEDGDINMYDDIETGTGTETEAREEALDLALDNIGRDDRMEDITAYRTANTAAEHEEMVFGDPVSFYDKLREQMAEHDLTQKQKEIMEYLIGSLDNDGMLRKSLSDICDELAIYHYIDTTEQEIEEVLNILHDFDPAGIGARSLQECLLLQIARRPAGRLQDLMKEVIEQYFDEFTKKHFNKIGQALHLTDIQTQTLINELRRLNPKPGAALGETQGRNIQQITPDFIIDTTLDGTITFSLNRGNIPELKVSQSFLDTMKAYHDNKAGMSKEAKQQLLYVKGKVERAQGFIDAIRSRRETLYTVMKTIIHIQRPFFLDGDKADLRPMRLQDIADHTGLALSTVSRVCNEKYAQTKWGIFKLREFFTEGITTDDGMVLAASEIKSVIKELIDNEDKHKPLSDQKLESMLKERGKPVARRTIAKYREQMGIPVARLRKE